MKKLMIAAAIVCAAVMAQASSYTWKSIKGAVYQAGSTTDVVDSQPTAYLFDAAKFSQADLIKALYIDKTYASLDAAASAKAISAATTTMADTGKVSLTDPWTYNGETAGTTWNAYFAIVDGDNVFVSDLASVEASALEDAQPLAFNSPKTYSQLAAKDGTAGFAGQGWYTAVPEPTSGLLLLLGVAGLALRRRRA